MDVDEHDQSSVEAFAAQWGLLGIFQHKLVQAEYLANEAGEILLLEESPDQAYRIIETANDVISAPLFKGVDNEFSSWEKAFSARTSRGTVLVRRVGVIFSEPLEEYYSRYFPGATLDSQAVAPTNTVSNEKHPRLNPDAGFFPSRHSPEFWDHLCEPISLIRWEIDSFRRAYQLGIEAQQSRETDALMLFALICHNECAGSYEDFTVSEDGKIVTSWRFPSLLSAAYKMLLWDFGGSYLRYCENPTCKKTFSSERSDKLYCSPTCTNTMKHRTYRQRKAEEEARLRAMAEGGDK